MIINLWSTPRTGSVWYSNHLHRKTLPSILLTEPFNRFHMDLYYMVDKNGLITNHHEYLEGSFYKNYLFKNGRILTEKRFEPRTRNIEEEEHYIISLLEKLDFNLTYIIHNHVSPMSVDVLNKLMAIGKNIFIYRKDKVAQLASYAIAYKNKEFVRYSNTEKFREKITITDYEPLRNLIQRIKVWDALPKETIVAYEDIDFYQTAGMPIKQVKDYRDVLTEESIEQITYLLNKEYFNEI